MYSNTVTFNNGSVGDNLNGGYSDDSGEVYGNTVVVNDGSVTGFINGGRSDTGDFHDNTVTVYDGSHGGVYGSYTYSTGNVARGTVNIYDGIFSNSVSGGRSDASGNVSDSVANIYGGQYTDTGQSVYGGRSITGDVTGNTLNVSGGTFGASTYLYGARSNNGSSGGGDATSNTVNISGDATSIAAGVYRSRDLTAASGAGARFDSRVLYAGLHAGVGYFHEFTERVGLKLYSKYMWTHQNSDRLDVLGEPIHFDAANSHAWKTGARTSFRATERASVYAGAAYEYEFNAKATGSVYGVALNPSKLKGSTGIFELGVTARPTPDSPMGVDVGVQAYVGKRKGVSGSVWFKYYF